MTISNIPLFSMLRTRMHWHQERQRILAENVSNADTPAVPAARPGAADTSIRAGRPRPELEPRPHQHRPH